MDTTPAPSFSFEPSRGATGEPISMDPRLQRLVSYRSLGLRKRATSSTSADEVAVIAKVTQPSEWEELSEVSPGAVLGDADPDGTYIVTGRIPVARIEHVRALPFVKSLKAARRLRTALGATTEETLATPKLLPTGNKAKGGKGAIVITTKGIKPLTMEEDENGKTEKKIDPHAWQSIANAKIYTENIRDALIAADPAGRKVYSQNAADFIHRLNDVEKEVKEAIAKIHPDKRRVITTHDAFGYFAAAYGMQFIAPQGVSTESEASARDVAKIISQIRKQKIPAVFVENISDDRLMQRIAAETGARIGGKLYSDALSDEKGPASTYIDMMRNNIRQFAIALTS